MSRWIWAYWLSPFTWNMQAMAINEMTSPSWGPSGKEALESFGFYTHRWATLHLPRVPPVQPFSQLWRVCIGLHHGRHCASHPHCDQSWNHIRRLKHLASKQGH